MPLYEKYRPKTWAEIVGQDKAVEQMLFWRDRPGFKGEVFWISGQSGTGKTTIARLIAHEVADELITVEMDAGELNSNRLRSLRQTMQLSGMGQRAGRAFIINEAHALRTKVLRTLLIVLEPLPAHVVVIFTSTSEGQVLFAKNEDDASALLSRCKRLDLARRNLSTPFAKRAQFIAEKEGLNARSIEWYVKLAKLNRNNLRAMLQAIETDNIGS
jgi:DNA polymerase III gamma/tau subunit